MKGHLYEDGMFQENSIETCILSRVKHITSQFFLFISLEIIAYDNKGDIYICAI